jgi:hypothetical protein
LILTDRSWFAFFLSGALAVLVHECGHVTAQWLCGMMVERVVWGAGPRIGHIGVLEIRMIPWSGYVTPVGAVLANRRWQRVLIALSGVLAPWFVVLLMILTQAVRVWWLKDFCVWWTFWSFMGLLQLLPFRHRDGWWVLVALGVLPAPPTDREEDSNFGSSHSISTKNDEFNG